jgi:hypothetical protein
MGIAQALGVCQLLKKRNNQPKDIVGGGEGCLTRDSNEGDGNKGGGQATARRAMATATAMAMAMTWEMVTALRLVDDKEGKGEGRKGNGEGGEGGG